MAGKKYTTAIIDDENDCINRIIRSLSAYPEISVTGIADNAIEGSALIMRARPDLIFTDIEMPGVSGLTMVQELIPHVRWNMHVVFHNTPDRYVLDAIRVNAFDFLLKPYSDEDFDRLMQRWFRQINKEKIIFGNKFAPPPSPEKTFLASTDNSYQLCKIGDFVYTEYSSERKTWVGTLNNQTKIYLKRGTRSGGILSLSDSFIQISQDCIINADYLSDITGGKCKMIPPFEEKEFRISRVFLKSLKKKFEGI